MNRTTVPLLLVSLLFVACSTAAPGATPSPSPTPMPTEPPIQAIPAGLAGRQFLSTDIQVDGATGTLLAGTRIRLTFDISNVSAHAGCNTISGNYVLDGDVFVWTGGAMTEMGCDPARHAQDDWLSTFLGSRPLVTLTGNDLTLDNGTIKIALLDREVVEPDQTLVGPTWVLTAIIDGEVVSSVPADASAMITFLANGTIQLQPGCNSGGGNYTVDGDTLRLSATFMTEMACAGNAGDLEHDVMTVLGGDALTFTIEAGSLTIMAGSIGLQFSAVEG